MESILLFLIIFMWTPPHFWALALYGCRDYERVGVPMLPVVAGAAETRRQILIYSTLLAPLAVAPYFIGIGGPVYLAFSIVLGIAFLWARHQSLPHGGGPRSRRRRQAAIRFSILYLYLLFAVLLIKAPSIA